MPLLLPRVPLTSTPRATYSYPACLLLLPRVPLTSTPTPLLLPCVPPYFYPYSFSSVHVHFTPTSAIYRLPPNSYPYPLTSTPRAPYIYPRLEFVYPREDESKTINLICGNQANIHQDSQLT